jgi:hypothetical protein
VLRPALPRTLTGYFRYCGSPEANIAHFDPLSEEKDLMAGDLFYFERSEWTFLLSFPALTRDHAGGSA